MTAPSAARACWVRVLFLAAAVSTVVAMPARASWRLDEFPILYSTGWPYEQVAGQVTEATLAAVRAAHYNTVMCGQPDLALVAAAGLRCLLLGRSQGAPDWIGESIPPATATRHAADPAVWGYYLMDEPDGHNSRRGATFGQLAASVAAFHAADPNHVAWINVSSETGRYLRDYMDVVKPDVLSFDLYRWWAHESDWWRGLEAHRLAALEAKVPMFVWVESNTSEQRFKARRPPPPGNGVRIRWSVYTSLAYGAKGIQWFLGSTDPDVAQLNSELSLLGPTLVSLQSTQVYHTSGIPREGRGLPETSWYHCMTDNLLIGEFSQPREPGATYLLIANKSIDAVANVTCDLRRSGISSVEEVAKSRDGATQPAVERSTTMTRIRLALSPGDGRLIRIVAP